jgi:uncharacterized protein (TIGR02145 family)
MSNEIIFTLVVPNPNEIKIGTQVWAARNMNDLPYYRNGDPIPQVTEAVDWAEMTTGAWCYYNNDQANGKVYGKLYNWYAVNDPRGLAPLGWHIPSDAEWALLSTFLGGDSLSGGKLKEIGTAHWISPNTGATNESGFTALPGGFRSSLDGSFNDFQYNGYWWTDTENSGFPWYRMMFCNYLTVYRNYENKKNGYSVRLIKD